MIRRGLLSAALALSACGGDAPLVVPPSPLEASIEVRAGERANPDGTGRPSPVVVHLHAVRDAGPAMSADFDTVIARPSVVLTPTLVTSQTLTLRPGETRQLTWRLAPDVTALVAVAEFRDPNAGRWRAMLAITEAEHTAGSPLTVSVAVSGDRIEIMRAGETRTD